MPSLRRKKKRETTALSKPVDKLEQAVKDGWKALADCEAATDAELLRPDWASIKASQDSLEVLAKSVQAFIASH